MLSGAGQGVSRWKLVGDALAADIAKQGLRPGDKLLPEADLAARFGVARETVRRAISHLQAEGLVKSERGRGTFVTGKVFEYKIATRKTFEQNLADNAMSASRILSSYGETEADLLIADKLQIQVGAKTMAVTTIGMADGVPVVMSRTFFNHALVPEMEAYLDKIHHARSRNFSTASLLLSVGIDDYRRHDLRLRARPASHQEQTFLNLAQGEYVIETESVSTTRDDARIFYSVTCYSSHRVEFYVGSDAFQT